MAFATTMFGQGAYGTALYFPNFFMPYASYYSLPQSKWAKFKSKVFTRKTLLITFVIAVILGVAAFFLIPRLPKIVAVSEGFYEDDTPGFSIEPALDLSKLANLVNSPNGLTEPITAIIAFSVNQTLESANYYPLSIASLKFNGQILDGDGNPSSKQSISGKSGGFLIAPLTRTSFKSKVEQRITISSSSDLRSPELINLLKSCFSGNGDKLKINIDAVASVAGFQVPMKDQIQTACPKVSVLAVSLFKGLYNSLLSSGTFFPATK